MHMSFFFRTFAADLVLIHLLTNIICMKTKTILVGLVAFVCAFVMISCSGDPKAPKEWNMEIEDDFRAEVAVGIMYAIFDEAQLNDLADKLDEGRADQLIKHLFDDHIAACKLTLEEWAETDGASKQCLEVYNALDVDFGEWTKQEDKDGYGVWTAVEKNSDIKVTFTNNLEQDYDWDLYLDDDDYEAYVLAIAEELAKEE